MRGDQTAFDEAVGNARHHLVVLEAARLRLVGVDHEVVGLRDRVRLRNEAPCGPVGRPRRRGRAAWPPAAARSGHPASSPAPSRLPGSRRSTRTRRASSGRGRRRLRARTSSLPTSAHRHRSSSTIAGTSFAWTGGGGGGRRRRPARSRSRPGTRRRAASRGRPPSSRRRGCRARTRTPRPPAGRPTSAHERFVQTSTSCSPDGLEVEHVVEGRDRQAVGGRVVERVGDLRERLRRQPAVALLRHPERWQHRRAAIRVASPRRPGSPLASVTSDPPRP